MQKFAENLPKIPITPGLYKKIPESPGIYIFFAGKTPIYIGKAINLKRRLSSYFDLHLEPKTRRMFSDAKHLSCVQVTSELEALLLEARLIRKYIPKYNIAAKDDKHPLYIQITKEQFPRITTARKIAQNQKNLALFGPFPSSENVRQVLRMLRRIFPYSDHKIGSRACLYAHIGLCNPCPNEILKTKNKTLKIQKTKEYLKNIKRIKAVLSGKFNNVTLDLIAEMKEYSGVQRYEEASKTRDQIKRLEYITQPQMPVDFYMKNPNLYEDLRKKELSTLKNLLIKNGLKIASLNRLECFDVAHLAGVNPTASMVTFVDGEADKNFYRHFKVYQKKGQSDVDSLREVIKRRLNHLKDWGKPDLIIVDGGKPQVGVFVRELEKFEIPVAGLAKRFETLIIPAKFDGTLSLKEQRVPRGPALNLVQRLRNEAHRFARRYHHALISKGLTN